MCCEPISCPHTAFPAKFFFYQKSSFLECFSCINVWRDDVCFLLWSGVTHVSMVPMKTGPILPELLSFLSYFLQEPPETKVRSNPRPPPFLCFSSSACVLECSSWLTLRASVLFVEVVTDRSSGQGLSSLIQFNALVLLLDAASDIQR